MQISLTFTAFFAIAHIVAADTRCGVSFESAAARCGSPCDFVDAPCLVSSEQCWADLPSCDSLISIVSSALVSSTEATSLAPVSSIEASATATAAPSSSVVSIPATKSAPTIVAIDTASVTATATKLASAPSSQPAATSTYVRGLIVPGNQSASDAVTLVSLIVTLCLFTTCMALCVSGCTCCGRLRRNTVPNPI
ncbi:hypothetical protein BC830DRAFT_1152084 [Chytriomyces sp. MP71]|nr:hypothetical protein BC830DRAFT_1152084 [Chytriomyces sp. MP71]